MFDCVIRESVAPVPKPAARIGLQAKLSVVAGVALFVIAKQDGSRAGQILGVAIPLIGIVFAIYFTL